MARARIDSASELDQRTVTCGFDDASSILSDFWIDQFAAAGFERRECSFLVITYEAAVASNVSRKNGGQPSFDSCLGHQKCPELGCLREASLRVGGRVSPCARRLRSRSERPQKLQFLE